MNNQPTANYSGIADDIRSGNTERLEILINSLSDDPNQLSDSINKLGVKYENSEVRETLLYVAVESKNTAAVQMILDVDGVNPNNGYSLIESVTRTEPTDMHCDTGYSSTTYTNISHSPLYAAIFNGHQDIFNLLINHSATNIFIGKENHSNKSQSLFNLTTPLSQAVKSHRKAMIESLLQNGAGIIKETLNISDMINLGVNFNAMIILGLRTAFLGKRISRNRPGFAEAITNLSELKDHLSENRQLDVSRLLKACADVIELYENHANTDELLGEVQSCCQLLQYHQNNDYNAMADLDFSRQVTSEPNSCVML